MTFESYLKSLPSEELPDPKHASNLIFIEICRRCKWNRKIAAEKLGVTRAAVQNKIDRLRGKYSLVPKRKWIRWVD